MRKSRFTEERIISALKEHAAGTPGTGGGDQIHTVGAVIGIGRCRHPQPRLIIEGKGGGVCQALCVNGRRQPGSPDQPRTDALQAARRWRRGRGRARSPTATTKDDENDGHERGCARDRSQAHAERSRRNLQASSGP